MGNSPTLNAPAAAAHGIIHYFTANAWIDGRATEQLSTTARLPGMDRVAGYPDLHPGRYGPVGAAFLADRIYPQLIGNDIGCGMSLFALDLPARKLSISKAARRLRGLEGPWSEAPDVRGDGFGSIGGGNHFCEVQAIDAASDQARILGLERGGLCLLVHSGSRGLGEAVFRSVIGTPSLDPDSDAGLNYVREHDLAVEWASANRAAIACRAARALNTDLRLVSDAPHNILTREGGLWLHRKGAAIADAGPVPLAGSRDSFSYLLAPTGSVQSPFKSLAHGAGRKHDRSSMHGRIRKVQSELMALTRTGFGGLVLCEDPDLLIEEAGSAYKSARSVADDLEKLGLSETIATLKPLITYKKTIERT
ncbi:RNA ligase RtcB family protein [Pseudosulfitobacter pseudonitzschiae]|uniref:RNA ligase RtcB family protein n=1 Tax=Pseudosulfitobacter pseudonitzschiae TaxID=1402135 RepID=UPI003B77F47D